MKLLLPLILIGIASLLMGNCCAALVSRGTNTSKCDGPISEAEYSALEQLFVSFNGSHWRWLETDPDPRSHWTFPSPLTEPCSIPWQGLSCFDTSGGKCSVFQIWLAHFELQGQIPQSLNSFEFLSFLDLTANHISGTIPTYLGSITTLTTLALSINNITGTIPSQLGYLSNLAFLELSENSLKGTLPSELGRLTVLEELLVSWNMLNGPLSSAIGDCKQLVQLYVDENYFTGSIPSELFTIPFLEAIFFDSNYFSGPLPNSIAQSSSLLYAYLLVNLLNGTLPVGIGNLTNLEALLLADNRLTGTIPASIASMSSLLFLSLEDNNFIGTIPSELCNITRLTSFDLSNNYLTGTIPYQLGLMKNIRYFYLNSNYIEGSLPARLGETGLLKFASFSNNMLTGAIPHALNYSTELEEVFASQNYITGEIPTFLFASSRLLELWLDLNVFSGSISSQISRASALYKLLLYDNLLTGSIPTQLWSLILLRELDLHNNFLNGTVLYMNSNGNNNSLLISLDLSSNSFSSSIPLGFYNMSSLQKVNMSFNQFTGILYKLDRLSALKSLALASNRLSGSLLLTASLLTLQAMDLSNNLLSGSIPSYFGMCTSLESLNLGNNVLTGQLPGSIGALQSLQFINVSSNSLEGSLDEIFQLSANVLPSLATLDISNNSFSGPFPNRIFSDCLKLINLIGFSNCFTGSLSSAICDVPNLTVVVLDSVTSAPTCDEHFPSVVRDIFKVIIGKKRLTGTLPGCVWSMSQLNTLHLSGNGIEGTLADLPVNSSLQYISLSSNRLVGSIPGTWQDSSQLVSVDLSSNKLSGTLSHNYAINRNGNGSIDLTVNRLSGNIPATFVTAGSIKVLDENLFECTSSSLPESDPDKEVYVCGSSSFNNALYFFAAALGSVLLLLLVSYRFGAARSVVVDILSLYEVQQSKGYSLPLLYEFIVFLRRSAMFFTYAAAFTVTVPLSFYLLMKYDNVLTDMFSTHQYQYTWSASIAYVHGVLPFVLLMVSIFVLVFLTLVFYYPSQAQYPAVGEVLGLLRHWCSQGRQMCNMSNVAVGATILLHCVVVLLTNILYVYEVLIGLPTSQLLFLQAVLGLFKIIWTDVISVKSFRMLRLSIRSEMICTTFVALFTFLVSPLIATLFTSDSCFRYIITGLPSVTSSFSVQPFECSNDCVENTCFVKCSVSPILTTAYSTVTPSWIYSYQCSSSILINYIPVLLISQVFSSVLMPMVYFAIVAVDRFWGYYLRIKSVEFTDETSREHPSADESSEQLVANKGQRKHVILNNYRMISKVYLNIGLALTFGLACPLLMFGILVEIWLSVGLIKFTVVRVMRYVEMLFGEERGRIVATEHLQRQLINSQEGSSWILAWILFIVVAFWSLFVIDIMGDLYGQLVGCCMLIVLVAMLFLSFIANYYYQRVSQTTKASTINSIEMNGLF